MTNQDDFNVVVELRILKQKLEDFMSRTDEFRKELSSKVDKLTKTTYQLPCNERRGIYTGIFNQLKLLWTFVSCSILAIIASWFKK